MRARVSCCACREAVARDDLAQARLAGALGGDLGVEVAAAFVGGAHVAEEEVEDGAVEAAAVVELDRRDDDAFLGELFGEGHRAGRDAADVGVVGAGGDEADPEVRRYEASASGRANHEDGRDHGDVGEVGAAEVGVVEDDDVAGRERGERHRGLDGRGHGAEVDGDVGGLGDEAAAAVEDGAGVVAPLLDVGRVRGAAEGDAHLVGDGGEEGVGDGEFGGVDAAPGHQARSSTRFPIASTSPRQPGGTAVVESIWTTIAGPAIFARGPEMRAVVDRRERRFAVEPDLALGAGGCLAPERARWGDGPVAPTDGGRVSFRRRVTTSTGRVASLWP